MLLIWIAICLLISLDSLLRLLLVAMRWSLPTRPTNLEGAFQAGAIVLIAARDETGSIGPTVASLLPQLAEWPASELWVVADNCVDQTATEARAAGANVAERTGGRLGKGAVIDWWLTSFPTAWADHSAVVILDADSRLKPGSLRHLGRVMASGADAAQSFVAPDAERTAGRLAGHSEVLMQRIDDEARRRADWPVPLRGTGMVFRTALLAELAPRLHTLAEDLELDVLLAARKARVCFVPAAVVLDPKPRESSGIARQRARWLQGQIQVLRDYWREIIQAFATLRLGGYALLIMLFMRPKVIFMAMRFAFLLGALVAGLPIWVLAVALTADALYYIAGALVVDNPGRYLLDLASAPRYVLLWCRSLLVAAFKRGGWLRAGR